MKILFLILNPQAIDYADNYILNHEMYYLKLDKSIFSIDFVSDECETGLFCVKPIENHPLTLNCAGHGLASFRSLFCIYSQQLFWFSLTAVLILVPTHSRQLFSTNKLINPLYTTLPAPNDKHS